MVFHGVPFPMEEILFDPQTSGGLLAAVAPEHAAAALQAVQKAGLQCGLIGKVTERQDARITVAR